MAEADRFEAEARGHARAPDEFTNVRVDLIPSFRDDARFGAVAKAAVAWNAVVDAVLSESLFFSVAHTLETRSELDCSVLLAGGLYYKQALRVLRGFLEMAAVHLYLTVRPEQYAGWVRGEFRVPPFRQRLLRDLLSSGVLSGTLFDNMADMYGILNGAIHGAERRYVNSGTQTGVIKRATAILPSTVGFRCDICHSLDKFEVLDDPPVAGYVTMRCRVCTNVRTVGADTWNNRTDRT